MDKASKLLAAVHKAVFDRGTTDDDAIDRLNHTVMWGLLLVFASFTGAKQFVGEPIACWIPAEYKEEKNFLKYANSYCWIYPMYKVDFEDPIPLLEEERFIDDISFYRWATVFFIFLAALFRLPHYMWKWLKSFSGANLEKIVGMTLDTVMIEPKEREKKLGHVAEYLHSWLTRRAVSYGEGPMGYISRIVSFIICFRKRSGHNLVTTYIFIKLLYLLNVIMQLVIISQFLKTNFWSYGIDAVSYFVEEGVWEDKFLFPRVALCDFKIRQMTNILTYTVQCVLSVNLFLEKMFLILWFCLIFMLIANAISLLKWIFELAVQTKTTKFLTKYAGSVVPGLTYKSQELKDFKKMVNKYLRSDGVFLLKMIGINTSDLLVVELLEQIWKRYKKYIGGLGSNVGNSVSHDEEK